MDLEDPNDPHADDGGDHCAVPDSGDTLGSIHGAIAALLFFTVGLGLIVALGIWLILLGRWSHHHPDEIVPKGPVGGVVLMVEGVVILLIGCAGYVFLIVQMCCQPF
jgi:hypothetical protein